MVRVGMRVGPFYASSSTRRRRGPNAAQRRAQAEAAARRRAHQQAVAAQHHAQVARNRSQRRATYGAYSVADMRTWFFWHWVAALIAIAVAAALPTMIGDGPTAEDAWLIAMVLGLAVWGTWVSRLHAAQAPARRAAAERAALDRQRAEAEAALARQQAAVEAARRAAEYAAYMAPKQVGNAWHHGACTINHRTWDVASRCRRG